MMMARLSLLNSLPRLASIAPFLCLMVAQWECPDMAPPSVCDPDRHGRCALHYHPPAGKRKPNFENSSRVPVARSLDNSAGQGCPAHPDPVGRTPLSGLN